ncbi:MAG TPA: preprotein translocase subunit SecE [Syntrophomonas sp.]|nr:preprotein translocase subunit SecE [Syntrophomonas sp.]HRW12975.1 preprotein translocase subunit SecE [Syntrophomonas sp.]
MAKNNTPAKQESGITIWWGNIREYLSSVYNELKKVYWPNRRQLIAYTGVVIITVTIVALILWAFDSGLSFLLSKFMDAFA